MATVPGIDLPHLVAINGESTTDNIEGEVRLVVVLHS